MNLTLNVLTYLGRYLGIINIKATYRDVETKSRGVVWTHPQQRGNYHDMFVDLEGALEIFVRSRKPKAVELMKWLTRKGFEKVAEEHRLAIDKKDFEIALLDGDLAGTQDFVRHLKYTNTEFQGEIRAKDQEIARSERENAMLRERYVNHCQGRDKDNVVMITRKHTCEDDDKHFEYPYYISRIQKRWITMKRRWLLGKFPRCKKIVIIDNPNSVHAFKRLEDEEQVERYGCHFKLIDLTREDLYDLGVPAFNRLDY